MKAAESKSAGSKAAEPKAAESKSAESKVAEPGAAESKATEPKTKEPKDKESKGKESKGKESKGKESKGKEQKAREPRAEVKPARLYIRYRNEVIPQMIKKFGYRNVMQVPKIEKISLNMGIGDATQDAKFLEAAVQEMTAISGQKPVVTKAKKSISNFKLREGAAIGCRVTLRRQKMYEFLDRLLNVAMPRIRDFRGVSEKGFDGRGSYTLGIREQIIFPEINYDKVVKIRGLNVTVVTSARTDEEALELLSLLGLPFRKKESAAA
ncbi:50S ribosomal protein L5 [bacterium]|nr:50S ribosomal protein L5 [bacterium]